MPRIVIRHVDGREFSVTREKFDDGAYPGFVELGAETPDAFIAKGIPKPKRKRTKPRAKDAAPVVEVEAEPDAETVEG